MVIPMMAYVVEEARRWIGPREVLRSAPARLRVQFWILVGSGVLLATVPVLAGGDRMPSSSLVPYWPMAAALIVWIFSAGMLLGKFNALKDSLERRVGALEATVVRADKLDDKLEVMATKIDALHKLLEQSDRNWRDSLHGAKE